MFNTGVWPLCFLWFVVAAVATGKAAVVVASISKLDVRNAVNGLAVPAATCLLEGCATDSKYSKRERRAPPVG
jgi:hypothetical protein